MAIAADTENGRKWNEVKYFDKSAYGMKVRRMDAHGGWLSSAIDMMRFIVRVDGFNTKNDIIKKSTFDTMMTGSKANKNYGKGWVLNKKNKNYFHNGSLPGTGAILVRTGSGMSWIFLANARYDNKIDGMMWDVVKGIKKWPKRDFF